MHITIAAGCFTLIVPSLGHDVQFYTGIQCRGERLGGVVGLTPDDGCQDGSLYSTNAQSVHIAQGDTDEDLIIAFYKGDKCPLENTVAKGNDGACLSVGGAYQQFDSYNALPIIPAQSQVNDIPSKLQHGALFEDDGGIAENAFRGVRADEWSSTMRTANTQPLPEFDDMHTKSQKTPIRTPPKTQE
ncbi:uncharacterized protein J4E88_004904 [Alternaria novae-zelandiae]|uniref:uncharacterized protein n=1 Tax=Alternaria novae-zelandiae TaxID=430562 RepID=UPI0020C2EB62|nr:uncharacterized protein J4E88_004904 [Alternaria novae-zelandiae]KAI4682017.1 hypothetical protein J4E88_004904 [Alternaria novae-zelandiae]